MDIFEEKACLCALNRTFGFEPRIAAALINDLGSAAEVFRLDGKEADLLLGPYSKYKGKICRQAVDETARELEKLAEEGIQFTGWTLEDYPALLKECEDPPVGLYIRSGTPLQELWKPRRRIAVVGTRDISPYGREWCRRIVLALASCPEQPVIVSGLALGTDICAHTTALECGLPTVGVMATGPESVYPYRHQAAADRMASTDGCALVTDYPPGTSPLPIHFLRRNRIIAGLCEATILIESKIKGGGMMTARLANSYCRDVYALPGRADDVRSAGCNHLIKSKIAEPVISTEDLLDSLGMSVVRQKKALPDGERLMQKYGREFPAETVGRMTRLLSAIRKERGITLEDLAAVTGLGYARTAELAGILESDGEITIDLLQRCHVNFMKKKL